MTRFSKGTTDHDGDGRMGGSRKGTNMAKKSTTKRAAKLKGEGMDVQSGMDPGPDPKVQQKAAADKFAEADARGQPETDEEKAAWEAEEARVGQQVRGY